jgi:hypothetical protein
MRAHTCSHGGCVQSSLDCILAANGKSCTAACTVRFSTCHQASQQAINTKAGFKHALTQAGQGSVAQVLVLDNHFTFPQATVTSIVLPGTPKIRLRAMLCRPETTSACAAAALTGAPRPRERSHFLPCFEACTRALLESSRYKRVRVCVYIHGGLYGE